MPDSRPKEWEQLSVRAGASRAILVHGPVLAGHDNSASLQRHAAEANGSPVFHFGPYRHAATATFGSGINDKSTELLTTPAHIAQTLRRYGPQLRAHSFHQVPASQFIEDAATLVAPARRLSGQDPALLLARVYDMAGSIDLLHTWESETGQSVDRVVLARSDLAIFSTIDAEIRPGEIAMAQSEGFSAETGDQSTRPRLLCSYRNRLTGDLVSGNGIQQFNADLLMCNRADLDRFGDLYQSVVELLSEGAPPDLDTLLHLLLVSRARLRARQQLTWLYEICRPGESQAVTQSDRKQVTYGERLTLLPRSDAFRARHGSEQKRVAVLLYGLLRDYTKTAGSMLGKVVAPNNASLFYYGPAQTDRPVRGSLGTFDEHGFFLSNPKGDFEALQSSNQASLEATYGNALKRTEIHQIPQEHFLKISDRIFPREEWMFMLSPHRLLSMFHNINGAVNLMRRYEDECGYAFDQVIITRPDLAFYTPIKPQIRPGEIHIAGGEGFDPNGYQHQGNAPVYFYKNASEGDYTPAGRHLSFNDQIFVLNRQDLVHFYTVYDDLQELLSNRIPASPETIFYMLLVQKAQLSLVVHPEWAHEIFRTNDPIIKGVNDTPDILHIDPHSPKAARFKPHEVRISDEHVEADPPKSNPVEAVLPAPKRELLVAGDGSGLATMILLTNRSSSIWARIKSRMLLSKARRESRSGRMAAAEQSYAKMLWLAPHAQSAWVQYGHVLKEQGYWRPAIGAYQVALTLKAEDAETALHLASAVRNVESFG